MATKKIPVDSLTIGMFIARFDRPWIDTPFLTHRFLVKTQSQLKKIKQAGIRFVEIDPHLGVDIASSSQTIQDNDHTLDAQIRLENQLKRLPETSPGTPLSNELKEVRIHRDELLHEVKDLLTNIRTSGRVDGNHAKETTQAIINQTIGHEEAWTALIRTREFSPDLYEHSLFVCTLSVLLGSVLGYDKSNLQSLALGALLHDVGLLSLPTELIRPTRFLSPTDLQTYHRHPELGLDLLKKCHGISEEVRKIVTEHHLTTLQTVNANSSLPQDCAPSSRLIRVVDEYDELLTGQGMKKPLPVKEALSTLYQQGQQQLIDLTLASHLITQIGIFPLYSLVELNTGERGIVTSISPGDLLHPIVLLIQNPDHQPYQDPTPVNFSSLSSQTTHLEIVTVLDPEREGINVEDVLADWVTL